MESPDDLLRSTAARARRAAALVAVACALGACAQFNVRSRQDPSADFGRLQTYAWLPPGEAAPADQRTLNRIISARIKRAVERELQGRGYRPADQAPDLLLNYRLATQVASEIRGDPRRAFSEGLWGTWPDSEGFYSDTYDEGALYVAVLDAASKRIIWVGVAGARIIPTLSMEKTEKRVDDAVHQIMERFPAR
jgi:hypothetical protein